MLLSWWPPTFSGHGFCPFKSTYLSTLKSCLFVYNLVLSCVGPCSCCSFGLLSIHTVTCYWDWLLLLAGDYHSWHMMATPSYSLLTESRSHDYFMTDSLPQITLSWGQAPWGSWPEIFYQLNPCGNSPHVTPSLMSGWFCFLWIGFPFVNVCIIHIAC
jgi:hypothetical protein